MSKDLTHNLERKCQGMYGTGTL